MADGGHDLLVIYLLTNHISPQYTGDGSHIMLTARRVRSQRVMTVDNHLSLECWLQKQGQSVPGDAHARGWPVGK